MTNTGEQAIAAANRQSTKGPKYGEGQCKQRVREAFGVPSDGTKDAIADWNESKHKHKTSDPATIPRGVPVWWSGGSAGHGHVAISAGDGNCWSTDISRTGYFNKVAIATIHTKWGLTLLGWTEDIDGVRVYTPPKEPVVPTKKPVKKPAPKPVVNNVTKAHALLAQALKLLNAAPKSRKIVHQQATAIAHSKSILPPK